MKFTPPVIAIIASIFAACAQAAAKEYHVTNLIELTNSLATASNYSVFYLAENTYDLTGVGDANSHIPANWYRFRGEPGTKREKIILKANGKRHFYAYKGFVEVTGMTLAGPDTGTGGGISLGNEDNAGFALTNCVFYHNVSSGDSAVLHLNTRGSQYVLQPRIVSNCAFVDNVAGRDNGVGKCPHVMFTDCVFTNNSSMRNIGVVIGSAGFQRCTFVSNHCEVVSGQYGIFEYWYGAPEPTVFSDCTFEGNYSPGSLIAWEHTGYPLVITNCTFTRNESRYGGCFYSGKNSSFRIVDSQFIENHSTNGILFGLSGVFNRCLFRGNNTDAGSSVFNYPTLVNCLILTNSCAGSDNNSVFIGSASVKNCTLVGNVKRGTVYRGLLSVNSVAVNSVFVDNSPNIYRNTGDANGSKFLMTNCVWNAQSATNDTMTAWLKECSVNGRLIEEKKMKFSPECAYLPLYGSPLRDTGYSDETYLSSVGDKDRAGNARVMFKGIDVGCYECQKMPGFLLLMR